MLNSKRFAAQRGQGSQTGTPSFLDHVLSERRYSSDGAVADLERRIERRREAEAEAEATQPARIIQPNQ